jgi:hypothetical protein
MKQGNGYILRIESKAIKSASSERCPWPGTHSERSSLSTKVACAKLVGICRDNQLFPSFYAPVLEATGTIRNRIGDAHGRGPDPLYPVAKEHADHMIRLASTNITFLVGLAGL